MDDDVYVGDVFKLCDDVKTVVVTNTVSVTGVGNWNCSQSKLRRVTNKSNACRIFLNSDPTLVRSMRRSTIGNKPNSKTRELDV